MAERADGRLAEESEDLQAKVVNLQRESGYTAWVPRMRRVGSRLIQVFLIGSSRLQLALRAAEQSRILKGAIARAAETDDADMLSGLAGNGMDAVLRHRTALFHCFRISGSSKPHNRRLCRSRKPNLALRILNWPSCEEILQAWNTPSSWKLAGSRSVRRATTLLPSKTSRTPAHNTPRRRNRQMFSIIRRSTTPSRVKKRSKADPYTTTSSRNLMRPAFFRVCSLQISRSWILVEFPPNPLSQTYRFTCWSPFVRDLCSVHVVHCL